ncbi:MAG: SpoIIE family protein phosphatase [Bacteroidales bacterium]|nr:SpoIIE family protein phosphatase [Bacteroidales bacterium]
MGCRKKREKNNCSCRLYRTWYFRGIYDNGRNSLLNEIITKYDCHKASDILNILREKVMNLLQQKGEDGEPADGMDIALCIIDCKRMELEYSGAYNPLYLVSNGQLSVLKGDRMPIGIHLNFQQPFSDYRIQVKPKDMIFLFSDGYADQFGGPEGKKFRYKNFQDLLVSIAEKSVAEQKEILHRSFLEWKGKEEQVDDVLIWGLHVNHEKHKK